MKIGIAFAEIWGSGGCKKKTVRILSYGAVNIKQNLTITTIKDINN